MLMSTSGTSMCFELTEHRRTNDQSAGESVFLVFHLLVQLIPWEIVHISRVKHPPTSHGDCFRLFIPEVCIRISWGKRYQEAV